VVDIEALYSIKEFAKFSGVRQSVLRYYDEIGLFSPVRRGENGYRYYSPYQIVPLNMIKVFIELDTPLREIDELAASRTPERVLQLLARQERKFDEGIRQLQASYSITHQYRALITRALSVKEGEIEERVLEETPLFVGPALEGDGPHSYFECFSAFCRFAERSTVSMSFPVGGLYRDLTAFREQPHKPARYFSLCPAGADRAPSGRYLSGFTRGAYGKMGDLPERLHAYAKEHSLTPIGPVYLVYLLDEISLCDQEHFLAQASVPVTAKRLLAR
jgi:DNA-binding transcriptional MerR regulator